MRKKNSGFTPMRSLLPATATATASIISLAPAANASMRFDSSNRIGRNMNRLLFAFTILAALGFQHGAHAAGRIQVLLLDGESGGPYHAWQATTPVLKKELEETGLLEVELPLLSDAPAGQVVPVRIESVVTELGTLELWMKHTNSERRWKIEFQVRTE